MTTEVSLPIDDEIAEAIAFEDEIEALTALQRIWFGDNRRAMFGMLRQARAITTRLAADEHWLALQRAEVERKNASAKRSLAFLEEQIKAYAETMLMGDAKHLDVPGAGRIQYRSYKASLHITDADAFMAALGPDERATLIEVREVLRTVDAKKYAEAVLETDGGVLLPGVETAPARRTATIEYEAFGA